MTMKTIKELKLEKELIELLEQHFTKESINAILIERIVEYK